MSRILAAMATTLLALCIAGCGQANDDTDTPTPASEVSEGTGSDAELRTWDEIVADLPPAGTGVTYWRFHDALGSALRQAYASDPNVYVHHGPPYESSGNEAAHEYNWYHFASPYSGGQPEGWDAVVTVTFVFTFAESPSSTVVEAIRVAERLRWNADEAQAGMDLGAMGEEVCRRLRSAVLDAFLPVGESFWATFDGAACRTGATIVVVPATSELDLRLDLAATLESGSIDRGYTITVVPKAGESTGGG